jgi:phage-related protein
MIFMGAGAALLILLGGLALAFAALTAAAAPLGIALGPLLLIVAAIAAVAAAAYLIYDNWGAISAWFGGLWEGIKAMVSGAIDFLINAFMTFHPLGLLIRAFMPALAYLQSLNFTEIGRNLIQGLINGVVGMLGALRSTIVGAASSVANWFKSKLGIHSPSRVFEGLGGFVMAGLDQGLANNTGGPLDRIAELSDRMTKGFSASPIIPRIMDLSGQMASAIGVGATGAAMAVASPAAAQQPATSPAAAAVQNHYTIQVTVTGGAQGQDIADQVREAIEQIERERRGRGFGDE